MPSEQDQARDLVRTYHDIRQAGAAGSFVFEWQDEWFKRTWNTVYATDQQKTPYWPDWQTNEQFFGLLAFDPGRERSVSYVDGDLEEWDGEDAVTQGDGVTVSAKYDEKFLYLMVRTEDGSALGDDVYLPIDTTPKSGAYGNAAAILSSWGRPQDDAPEAGGVAGVEGGAPIEGDAVAADGEAESEERTFVDAQAGELPRMTFDRGVDFIVALHREGESRVAVQERYECLRPMMMWRLALDDAFADPPASDSTTFRTIELALRTVRDAANDAEEAIAIGADDPRTFETGLLREGDGNPAHEGYDYSRRLPLRPRFRGGAPALAAAQLLQSVGDARARRLLRALRRGEPRHQGHWNRGRAERRRRAGFPCRRAAGGLGHAARVS